MLIRALIVLLLVLNLGVAAWWLTQPPPHGEPLAAPSAVPALRLVDAGEWVAAAPAPAAAAPGMCISYGPFSSAEAAAQARLRVQPLSIRDRTREVATAPYRAWKVWLPPFASLDEAEAMSSRVAAAGFSDRFVIRDGPAANSLALGRFTSEAPARERAAELAAAGFPATAEPIGTGPASHWLDVAAQPTADAALLRRLAAAPEARELDCANWK